MSDSANLSRLNDRRRYPRKPLKLKAYFKFVSRGKVSQIFESRTEDLGAGGVGLMSEIAMPVGEMLMLSLWLPWRSSNEEEDRGGLGNEDCIQVAVVSRVVWCSPSQEKFYRVGVEFLELDNYSRQQLKAFLIAQSMDWGKSNLYN